ncbi:rCG22493 [Rattus norvegicus]|uniref:RCG22493 n=1 Tax=Rattus norvegicus TaxID=10116 RepID=A6INM4_RAT|nr:rCG22493 [Rattus norvegicus]
MPQPEKVLPFKPMRRSRRWTSPSNSRNLPAINSKKARNEWSGSLSTGDLPCLGPQHPWVQPPVD